MLWLIEGSKSDYVCAYLGEFQSVAEAFVTICSSFLDGLSAATQYLATRSSVIKNSINLLICLAAVVMKNAKDIIKVL